MSIPMICSAALRASAGVRASLIPPALPRPPTGTCALTATGPSLAHAAAASSAVRATSPGGMAMPSEARTSLAWYSSSFTLRGRVEWAVEVAAVVARPAVAEAALEVGVVQSKDGEADSEHEDDHERKPAADQDRRKRRDPSFGRRLHTGRPPGRAVPVLQAVIGYPTALGILFRHRLKCIGGGGGASRWTASGAPSGIRIALRPAARSPASGRSVVTAGCCRAIGGCAGAPCASRCGELG